MSNPITLPDIIADLKVRDFLPHTPLIDNGGVLEAFSKYNFSFVVKGRCFYALDNDGLPLLLFIANDGDVATTGLFVARDISVTPTGSNFVFSNNKLTIPGVTGNVLSLDNVSALSLTITTDTGKWSVQTNGDYYTPANWTSVKLPSVGNSLSQAKSENGNIVTWDENTNNFIVTDINGVVKSTTTSYLPAWCDTTEWTPRINVITDGTRYGQGALIPVGDNVFYHYQHRGLYTSEDFKAVILFCAFRINADGSLTWIINPATAGWKTSTHTSYSNVSSGSSSWGFYWDVAANQFHVIRTQFSVGYATPTLYTVPTVSTIGSIRKNITIPDTSPISKSSYPGWYYEIGIVGSDVYALRAGTNSSGKHVTLGRYTLIGGVPTLVPNGLTDGSTLKEVMSPWNLEADRFFTVKKGNVPYLYTWDHVARTIQSITYDPATSNIKYTTVKNYNPVVFSANEVLNNVIYDQWGDRLFYLVSIQEINGGNRLYQHAPSNGLIHIGNFGIDVAPTALPVSNFQITPFLDLDRTDPMFWLTGTYPIAGFRVYQAVTLTMAGVMKSSLGASGFVQMNSWSKLLNAFIIAYSLVDQHTWIKTFTIDVNNITTLVSTLVFKLPTPVGLGGFVNNGWVHLGGYTTGVYSGLEKGGNTPAFTLPANSTCYLYLIRTGPETLKLKVGILNEPNTFYKIQIASFVTNTVGVVSSVAKINAVS